MQLLWFKRDLRVVDHMPLFLAMQQARQHGKLVPLYIHEPSAIADPHTARQHQCFVHECLDDLRLQLEGIGGYLLEELGEATDVLERLHHALGFTQLWSHQETTQRSQFKRDLAVKAWCRSRGVVWHEVPQNNTVRAGLQQEKLSFQAYLDRAAQEPIKNPLGKNLQVYFAPKPVSHFDRCQVPLAAGQDKPQRQRGGRQQARAVAARFFTIPKLRAYPYSISSPLRAWEGASRLSPYLAYGVVSDREVLFKLNSLVNTAHGQCKPEEIEKIESAARFYVERFIWRHSYFQQFERTPQLEDEALLEGEAVLTQPEEHQRIFTAWRLGHTGFPYMDALQRSLHATGWLNMRARAALVSFGCVQLGLNWREVALHLAREFLDFEPAIHYGQVRIASGTSHFERMLVYDPIKQSQDHDPKGVFIKRWVPELRTLPVDHVHAPSPQTLLDLGLNYPAPLVDNALSLKTGKARLAALRK